jgi:phenol 2-monooxygenase (NADPH)
VLSQKVGISRFTQCCINQGVIEQTFVDLLKAKGKVEVERNIVPEELVLDRSVVDVVDAYPITIKVQRAREEKATSYTNGTDTSRPTNGQLADGVKNAIDGPEEHVYVPKGETEIIKAKYLLGCDGAHSWTRRQLGLPMEGEHTDHFWGVIDIIPLTNFREPICTFLHA